MFGPTISGLGLFGDGSYSGNVFQGGSAIQPQDYLLDGVTPLKQCIVVTGAATVPPSAETGASVVMARNVVVIGASATLAPSTNSKGLILLCRGGIYVRSGGKIHIDKLGKAGRITGGVSAWDLAPLALRKKISRKLHAAYVASEVGANGGPGGYASGQVGVPASAMQTGGGGGSGLRSWTNSNAGGKGGTCCGGGGAGGGAGKYSAAGYHPEFYGYGTAPDYGPGGTGYDGDGSGGSAGGPGDPPGTATITGNPANPGVGSGGGHIGLYAPVVNISSGCIVSADGAAGSTAGNCPSGGAGGGRVVIVVRSGGYTNNGTVRANGGANVSGPNPSGAGGAGSVNLFTAT
jgi:hypothetical protein